MDRGPRHAHLLGALVIALAGKAGSWLLRTLEGLINAQDPTHSPRQAGYLVGVAAGIVWLTRWTWTGPWDGNLVAAYAAFFALIGLVKAKGNDDAPSAGGA